MKKLLSIVLSFAFIYAVAQEPVKDANFYKGEGNTAYQAKDYAKAYENYKTAVELLDADGVTDTVLVYNTGFAAYKAKMYEEAIPFFDKAGDLGYKEDKPYQTIAACQSKLDDYKGMEATTTKGLEKYPDSDKLKELLAHSLLKQGLEFYNEGNDIKKAANESGWNTTDPEKFTAEYERADAKYKEALPFMQKAHENDPTNSSVLKALINIYTNLDNKEMVEKYNQVLEQLGS